MLCRSKVSWCLVSWGKWAQFLCAGEDTSPLFPQGCSLPRFSLKAEKLELLWNNPPGLWCLGTEVPRATASSTQFPRLLSGGDRWICCSSYKKDLWDVPGWSTGLTDTKPFQGMGFLNAPQRSSGCLWGLFLEKNTAQNTLWAGIMFPSAPQNLGTEQLPAPGLLSFLSQIQSPDLQPAWVQIGADVSNLPPLLEISFSRHTGAKGSCCSCKEQGEMGSCSPAPWEGQVFRDGFWGDELEMLLGLGLSAPL